MKSIANIGQLKAVFSLRFDTLPNANTDTDGDGMPDEWETDNGFDPNDPNDAAADPDGDGLTNEQENTLGTDPNSFDQIGPVNFDFDEEIVDFPELSFRPEDPEAIPYEHPSDLYHQDSVEGWKAAIGEHIEIWDEGDGNTYAELQSHWDAKGIEQEFNMLPGTTLTFILRYKGRYDAYIDSNPFKLKVEGAHEVLVNGEPAQTQGTVKEESFMDDDEWEKYTEWQYAVITITSDPQATTLVPITLTLIPDDTDESITYGGFVNLIPVEVAPEVLKVNADFDEGRLDPTTGYAIPDCYDVGNSLKAEIDHLNGTYAKDEVITDDLHKGWFGVNPQLMDDNFWDGATVTISKITKPNTTYGGDQEGNVRFYATWEDAGNGGETAYQAIGHFDTTSLTPINLVGSVYGSSATIPANAEFWIEGIRGGQITLEWKYKKGDVELLFEQEFLVATEQSKQDWIDEIVYEIRLQSSDDIGGEVDITTFATTGLPSFAANKEQLFEMYDYYPELFLQTYGVDAADRDEVMAWYGLARCTTAEIVGGLAVMEDVYIKAPTAASVTSSFSSPILGPLLGYLSAHSRSTIREIQQALYLGAWDIFEDLAWQGRAYRASGIYALEYVDSIRPVIDFRFDGWNDIDRGRRAGNIPRIRIGVQTLADREQNVVVQPAFTVVQGISVSPPPTWPVSVNADDVFSLLAENPVPGGISFGDWRGWSLLKNVAVATDRWDWATHAPDGIIPQWYTKTPAQHEALDLEHIEVRGRDFHARKYWPGEEPLLESEWQNDRPSRPHITRY